MTGSITTAVAKDTLQVNPGQSASYTVSVALAKSYSGKAVLERSVNGGLSWDVQVTFDGSVLNTPIQRAGNTSGTIANESGDRQLYRFRGVTATADDALDFTLARIATPTAAERAFDVVAREWAKVTQPLNLLGYFAFDPLVIHSIQAGLASGNVDLYTCPAGRKAIFSNVGVQNNHGSGTSISWYLIFKKAGESTYYRVKSTVATGDTSYVSTTSLQQPLILEPGDVLGVNTTATDLKVWLRGIECDASFKPKTVMLRGLATGDNLLYTADAAGRGAVIVNGGIPTFAFQTAVVCASDAGGNRTWTPKVNDQADGGSVVNASVVSAQTVFGVLAPGDTVKLNLDTGAATQLAWVNVVEL